LELAGKSYLSLLDDENTSEAKEIKKEAPRNKKLLVSII